MELRYYAVMDCIARRAAAKTRQRLAGRGMRSMRRLRVQVWSVAAGDQPPPNYNFHLPQYDAFDQCGQDVARSLHTEWGDPSGCLTRTGRCARPNRRRQ